MQTAQAYSHCQRLPTALQTELLDCDLGIWDWDLITGKTYDDPQWKKILGYELVEEVENHHQQRQKYGGRSHKAITQRFSLTLIEDNQISDLVRDLNLHWRRQKVNNSTLVLYALYFLLPFALPFGQSRI